MESTNTKAQPVLFTASVLAALTAFSGSLAALGLDNIWIGVFGLIVAAINVGVGVYVKGQVVPYQDTAAYKDDNGRIVAGPAAVMISDGAPAAVVQDLTP